MVNKQAMVQLQEVLSKLARDRGSLRLAMLMPTELPNRWNLLVSAPWMDTLGPRSAIKELTSRLLNHVDRNFLSAIDRVSVVPGTDPFVERITDIVQSFLGVNPTAHEGGYQLRDATVEGRDIPEAFVFAADTKANGKPASASRFPKAAQR